MARHETLHFLEILYPDMPVEKPWPWLILSRRQTGGRNGKLHSEYFFANQLEALAGKAQETARDDDVYLNIGLRSAALKPKRHKRGGSTDVCAIPALWGDWDLRTGNHAKTNLPTEKELLDFLVPSRLPLRSSCIPVGGCIRTTCFVNCGAGGTIGLGCGRRRGGRATCRHHRR
jgi:hypothetical protein